MNSHLSVALVALFTVVTCAATMAGCERSTRPRCAECGMYADQAARWQAGATGADGSALRFDSPKCLLRFRASGRGRGLTNPWWTEYYTQAHLGAQQLVFVRGSDLISPMGHDLVPVAARGDAAADFVRDHGGEIVRPEAVDGALLDAL